MRKRTEILSGLESIPTNPHAANNPEQMVLETQKLLTHCVVEVLLDIRDILAGDFSGALPEVPMTAEDPVSQRPSRGKKTPK